MSAVRGVAKIPVSLGVVAVPVAAGKLVRQCALPRISSVRRAGGQQVVDTSSISLLKAVEQREVRARFLQHHPPESVVAQAS